LREGRVVFDTAIADLASDSLVGLYARV